MKHTKGEWMVESDMVNTSHNTNVCSKKRIVARCYTNDLLEKIDKSESEANAKLIAAAPSLYNELSKTLGTLKQIKSQLDDISENIISVGLQVRIQEIERVLKKCV